MRHVDFLSRALLVSLLVSGLAGTPLFAQGSCDLDAAKEHYQLAQFVKALENLEGCRESERSPLWEVYRLRAMIYIAQDRTEEARDEVENLLRARPGFEPGSTDPPQLSRLIDEVRSEEGSAQVTVVSRIPEELRRAPAVVAMVTADQIERRGYLDLEEVFYDLPGFDISRGNGEIYANLLPRGFRATANDRMLLLVDGVEQNDLSSGTAHLSRQYSLFDIERVEVLHGPASALYGANAYAGVIRVVTRPPEAFLEPGDPFGAWIAATTGSLDTRAADFTLAYRLKGQLTCSITGRLHESSELDLSRFDDRDYRYDVDYGEVLRLTGEAARVFAETAPASPLYRVVRDAGGAVMAVEPTAEAELLARDLDRRALSSLGALSFSDKTEDWSLSAKVRMANLVLGFQTWRREEGSTSWYTELSRPGQDRGNVWTPTHTAFFINFSFSPLRDIQVRMAAHYRQSGLDGDATSTAAFQTYFSGGLGLRNLIPCDAGIEEESCRQGRLLVERFSQLSTEVAGEVNLAYQRPERGLSAVGGFEFSIGSIQSEPGSLFFRTPATEHTDFGIYTQARLNPLRGTWRRLELVAAGRVDYNRIDSLVAEGAGYGSVFSPRLAVLYDLTEDDEDNDLLLKAIYSRGFRQPYDFERAEANRKLDPEQVDNVDLSLSWHRTGGDWTDGVTVEVAGYLADYTDLIRLQSTGKCLKPAPIGCDLFETGFRNGGEVQAHGGYLNLSAERKGLKVFGNYTYTSSRELDPIDAAGLPLVDARGRRIAELQLADLARHRANLGFNTDLDNRWNFDLRFNYVAARRSPGGATETPSHLLTHVSASYRDILRNHLPGMSLQLVVRNLLDESYQHPGVQLSGRGFAELIPQPGRTLYLRVLYHRKQRLRP